MEENPKKPQKSSTSVICILGACYLIYTATQMFHLLGTGKADSPALCIFGGGGLGLCGVAILIWQWRLYRKDKKKEKEQPPEKPEEEP